MLEAARVLGCAKRTVRNYMAAKLIPYYKFGRRLYFKPEELIAAVQKCRVN